MDTELTCDKCGKALSSVKRSTQVYPLCALCEEKSEQQLLKNERRRQKDFVDSHIIVCRPKRRNEV